MYTLSSVVLVLVLTGICTAQQRTALSEWTADDYPNPMKDPALCGRYDKSFVCDPNGLLTLKEADTLDWLLRGLFNNDTKCPCSDHKCETKKSGYVMAVALVRKLRIDKEGNVDDNDKSSAIRQFAFNLENNKWKLGDCNEDIIIAYSAEDRVIFTMVGGIANKRLNQDLIDSITTHKKHYFRSNKHVYAGLRSMILDYREALSDGGFIYSEQVDQSPIGGGVRVSSSIMSLLTLVFCLLFLQ